MPAKFVVGKSRKMKNVYSVADRVAPEDLNILICGEPGCGKNTLAEYIHKLSGRKGKFHRLNPVVFDKTGSEFDKHITETFHEAQDGTLIIDDVSYCSLKLQDYLLKRWREEDSFAGQSANVRLIGITSRDLQALAAQRRFRRSLTDRFVIPIILPPLRERKDDILPLANIFISESGAKNDICKDAFEMLNDYSWPGNVRELESVLKYAIFHAGEGEITPSHLPERLRRKNASAVKATVADELYKLATGLIESGAHSEEMNPYEEYSKIVETPLVQAAMEHAAGNKSVAAKLLKINRNTISKKIKDYDIE